MCGGNYSILGYVLDQFYNIFLLKMKSRKNNFIALLKM